MLNKQKKSTAEIARTNELKDALKNIRLWLEEEVKK
jgi:hypothetical protein